MGLFGFGDRVIGADTLPSAFGAESMPDATSTSDAASSVSGRLCVYAVNKTKNTIEMPPLLLNACGGCTSRFTHPSGLVVVVLIQQKITLYTNARLCVAHVLEFRFQRAARFAQHQSARPAMMAPLNERKL